MYTDCWCVFLPRDLPDINIYYFLYVKLQTKNIRHYQFTIQQTWIDCLNLASFASTMKWHFTDTDFSGTLQWVKWVYNTWIIVYCKYCKWDVFVNRRHLTTVLHWITAVSFCMNVLQLSIDTQWFIIFLSYEICDWWSWLNSKVNSGLWHRKQWTSYLLIDRRSSLPL